eukprot:767231-Hanusia_phi.AAC.8
MAGFEYSRLAATMQDELVVKDRQLADAHRKISHLEARIEQLIGREGTDSIDGEKKRDISFQDLMNENEHLRQALEEQKFLIDERLSDEEVTHIQFRSMEDEISSLKQHIADLNQRLMVQTREMARMEEGAKMQIEAASVELKRVKAEMKDWQQFATTTEDRLMKSVSLSSRFASHPVNRALHEFERIDPQSSQGREAWQVDRSRRTQHHA